MRIHVEPDEILAKKVAKEGDTFRLNGELYVACLTRKGMIPCEECAFDGKVNECENAPNCIDNLLLFKKFQW